MPGEEAPFAERLRRLRESAGLTREELASRAGPSAETVSALKRGERRRPTPTPSDLSPTPAVESADAPRYAMVDQELHRRVADTARGRLGERA